ncbi:MULTISPECIES: hypothetical protein [Pseudomonas]|uniref:hypothetical protein n=1 Tax=Pseudomonas TaxID=286 RepID=UPI0011B48537|nr:MULTISPECIES: hypothetical protein [Pseudomonas]MCA5973046.1 hypothetical protein [Pseudomonas sp. P135]MCH5534191.1 hypothetical protein [Pseudomonas syringae pv. syringae]MCH5570140.1 hypothetical protein [Pseudomonas syringae pv. syringae]
MKIRSVIRCILESVVFLACAAFLIVALILTMAFGFGLSKSEAASWVQAIGAIVSIWVAWWISAIQGRRAARLERQKILAKCEAIIGLLRSLKAVVKPDEVENDGTKAKVLKLGLERASKIMDAIDISSLPDPVFVDSVFSARKEVETLMAKLSGAPYLMSVNGLGVPDRQNILKRLDAQIDNCMDAVKRL